MESIDTQIEESECIETKDNLLLGSTYDKLKGKKDLFEGKREWDDLPDDITKEYLEMDKLKTAKEREDYVDNSWDNIGE